MPRSLRLLLAIAVPLALFLPPWAEMVAFGPRWPTPVWAAGTALFAAALLGLPTLFALGHFRGRPGRRRDVAAVLGDSLLGASWVLCAMTLAGAVLQVALALGGVGNPGRSRLVAFAVLAASAGLLVHGGVAAWRLPRIRRLDVRLSRLGAGLDGLRVVLITDTHFGPLARTRWSARVVERINALDADLVCHAGDLADGSPDQRAVQVRPLGAVRARLGRYYVTGNHEYFGDAQRWLDHMAQLGWRPLHNQHRVLERGGDRLVLAGVDDATAAGYRLPGHGMDLAAALAGADPALPVILLAHQPKAVHAATRAGVDLQLSGHTHGGQIWPFHHLVRIDQPVLAGLSRHGTRTLLYTSRGTGFWGPPLRVFAPSEITLLTLRAPA